jgi:hypothetical protein
MRTDTTQVSEPSMTPIEAFEPESERELREWYEAGASWSYFLVEFLRGNRGLEIQPGEITGTQLYKKSPDAERKALEFVCATDVEQPPSPADEQYLRERDQFLADFVVGRIIGHSDLVAQIASIPRLVAERETFDQKMFPRTFRSPRLFQWIWGSRG